MINQLLDEIYWAELPHLLERSLQGKKLYVARSFYWDQTHHLIPPEVLIRSILGSLKSHNGTLYYNWGSVNEHKWQKSDRRCWSHAQVNRYVYKILPQVREYLCHELVSWAHDTSSWANLSQKASWNEFAEYLPKEKNVHTLFCIWIKMWMIMPKERNPTVKDLTENLNELTFDLSPEEFSEDEIERIY